MSLIDERNKWYKEFYDGAILESVYLDAYIRNRDSELWRSTRIMEEMCEYILHLEELCSIVRVNEDE